MSNQWVARLGFVVCLLCAHPTPAATQTPTGDTRALNDLVSSVGAYAERFRDDFRTIIGTERYQQTVRRSLVYRGPRTRRIDSDIFFTPVGVPPRFMTVRSTARVDGRAMSGAHERVLEALASTTVATRDDRLRALATEGARYNLGPVGRTFNDPTLALMFLTPELRGRFSFTRGETSTLRGQRVQRLVFREVTRPSLIRDERDNIDGEIHGALAVGDDGRVLESELVVNVRNHVEARVHVRYAAQPSLQMWLPESMDEDYRSDEGAGRGMTLITCTARYSGYRRFETSARILTP